MACQSVRSLCGALSPELSLALSSWTGLTYSLRRLFMAPKGIGAANVSRLALAVLLDDDQIVGGHLAAPEGSIFARLTRG